MSQESHEPLSAEERGLAEQLQRTGMPEPSAALDQRIRAQAHAAVQSRRPRWSWGMGAAAAAVLSALMLHQTMQSTRQEMVPEFAPAPAATPVIAPGVVPTPQEQRAHEVNRDKAAESLPGADKPQQPTTSVPEEPALAEPFAAEAEAARVDAARSAAADAPANALRDVAPTSSQPPAAASAPPARRQITVEERALPAIAPATPPSSVSVASPAKLGKSAEESAAASREIDERSDGTTSSSSRPMLAPSPPPEAPPAPVAAQSAAADVGADAGADVSESQRKRAANLRSLEVSGTRLSRQASQPDFEFASFEDAVSQVRGLLAEGQRDRAVAMLREIKQQYPQEPLPEDLAVLLGQPP